MPTETKQSVLIEDEPRLTTALATRQAESPMALIRLAVEANADPERLGKLMDLQERFERNEASKAFAVALAQFQAECPVIRKRREAAFNGQHIYNFASLDDILQEIQPLLTAHGLAINFSAGMTDAGFLKAECRVRCGLHVEATEIVLPVPAEMRVNATQKMGAALSYAKRYALCAALNLIVADEDNDAAALDLTPVSDEQAIQLEDIAGECPAGTKDRCLAWLGVASFRDCPAARFGEVKDMLLRKQKGGRK